MKGREAAEVWQVEAGVVGAALERRMQPVAVAWDSSSLLSWDSTPLV